MTKIHARQLQQYTQDNYNNKHKTTTTIHARQLQQYTQDNYQQYTQDNYNNTHKTTTTIHTRQLTPIDIRQLTTIHTRHLKLQHVQKVNNTKVKRQDHEIYLERPCSSHPVRVLVCNKQDRQFVYV